MTHVQIIETQNNIEEFKQKINENIKEHKALHTVKDIKINTTILTDEHREQAIYYTATIIYKKK